MSRTTQGESQQFDIEHIVSDIQRGIYQTSSFFGSVSSTPGVSNFIKGVDTALKYSGATRMRHELVDVRDPARTFRLTKAEWELLEKRARSISQYGNIPYDISEDFLQILCFIDNIEDMRLIADAVQLPELDSEYILRKPKVILDLPNLEKVCYAASALEGLIAMFKKYTQAAQYANERSGESMLDILSNFNLGSMAISMIESGNPGELAGTFLTELITGKRIPTNVIAKNPNNQSPSYVGKAFFGESPIPLANVDIEEVFNKAIAVFPKPSAGAGTTAFSFQNAKSFDNILPLDQFVSGLNFGSINIPKDSFKEAAVNNIVTKINGMLGTHSKEMVDVRRADNALPMMLAISAINSNSERSHFTIDTFRNAWVQSRAISSHLQQTDPSFIESVRKFL